MENTRTIFIYQQLLSSHFLWSPPSPSFKTDTMEKPLSLVFSFLFLWKPNPYPLPVPCFLPVSHVLPAFVLIYPLPSIMHPHITPFASSNYYPACILFINICIYVYCPHWYCTQKPATKSNFNLPKWKFPVLQLLLIKQGDQWINDHLPAVYFNFALFTDAALTVFKYI